MHQFLQSLIGHPVAFSLGAINVSWYGIAYIITFISGWIWLTKKHIPRSENLILILIISGLIGARIFYLIFTLVDHSIPTNMLISESFKFWDGGLSWHGGLLFASFTGYLYCKKQKLDFWFLANTLAPVIAFGSILVRLANFINGELPGKLTSAKFGFIFPELPGYRFPQSLYEALSSLILLIILVAFSIVFTKNILSRNITNSAFVLTIGWMALTRFIIEFWRESDITILKITGGQWLSIFTLIAIVAIRQKRNNGRSIK